VDTGITLRVGKAAHLLTEDTRTTPCWTRCANVCSTPARRRAPTTACTVLLAVTAGDAEVTTSDEPPPGSAPAA
jgi:hypothetical protein